MAAWMLRLATASPTRKSMNSPSSLAAVSWGRPAIRASMSSSPSLRADEARAWKSSPRAGCRARPRPVDLPLDVGVAVLVADHRAQAVAFALDPAQAVVRGQAHPPGVEALQVRREVGGADLVRAHAVRSHELDGGAARGEELRRARGLVVAVVVEDEHLGARLDLPAEHVPHAHHVLRALEPLHVRHPSGGDHHDVRALREHVPASA